MLLISFITACGGGGGGASGDTTPTEQNETPNTNDNQPPEGDPTLESPSSEISFVDTLAFDTTDAFVENLLTLELIEDSTLRLETLSGYWSQLINANRIPFVTEDGVIFLYRSSSAQSVIATGDWNWFTGLTYAQSNADSTLPLTNISGTNLWYASKSFASDARLDYKFIVDSRYILDPRNNQTQTGGYGDNSYFAMPDYEANMYKRSRTNVASGTLSEEMTFQSNALGYEVKYSVYLPYNYNLYSNLPTVYFLDGYLYADSNMGAAVTTLDNLIADQMMPKVIAVFVDSSNASSNESRRTEQYLLNPSTTANFFKQELIPHIDSNYPTSTQNTNRTIVGVSDGGAFASYMCFFENTIFSNCGIQSPEVMHGDTLNIIQNTQASVNVNVALSTGNIGDVVSTAQSYRDTLESNGYSLFYQEQSQGHSWGNWSDSLPDILLSLVGN